MDRNIKHNLGSSKLSVLRSHSRDYTSSPERGRSNDKQITSSKAKGNRRNSTNHGSRHRQYSDAQIHKNHDATNKKESETVISNQNSLVSRNCDSCNTVKDRETPVSN